MNVDDVINICVSKTKNNLQKMKLGLREYPPSADGDYFNVSVEKTKHFFHIMNWTASFYTGMALLSFEKTKDLEFLRWLNGQYPLYYAKVFDFPEENMHDLGFLYSLYSVPMYRLTGDINQRKVSLKAADELSKRFILNGGYLKAWGRMDGKTSEYVSKTDAEGHFFTKSDGLAIIDCMMNLPLLFWASQETGNQYYQSIAKKHADTTMKYFIREDGSVYHAFRFNISDGSPAGGCNYCGYGDESFWARGITWAIYGFAIAYGYTKKKEYLETAVKLAYSFIDHLGKSPIPVWDFRLPDGEPKTKDSSAAAIAVCGFMEILKYDQNKRIQRCVDFIMDSLMSETYTNLDPNCPGLLKKQNGMETYFILGDFFYMEALAKKQGMGKIFW